IPATELLANLNLVRDTEIPQTIDLLRKARTFAPGNDNLAVMLAFALSRTPDHREARGLAESVLMKNSLTPAMLRNADTVLRSLSQAPTGYGETTQHPEAPEGTFRIQGTFMRPECSQRILLVLRVNGRTVKLHSRTL